VVVEVVEARHQRLVGDQLKSVEELKHHLKQKVNLLKLQQHQLHLNHQRHK
jgi:hypothetical protein